eukprot:410995-Pleurochrysis_carterae.AAC.1
MSQKTGLFRCDPLTQSSDEPVLCARAKDPDVSLDGIETYARQASGRVCARASFCVCARARTFRCTCCIALHGHARFDRTAVTLDNVRHARRRGATFDL